MAKPQASAAQHKVLINRIQELRTYAIRGLPRMYNKETGLFNYQLVNKRNKILPIGSSLRYSAIAFIGLSGESEDVKKSVFGDKDITEMFSLLYRVIPQKINLGDIALLLWAANTIGYEKMAT